MIIIAAMTLIACNDNYVTPSETDELWWLETREEFEARTKWYREAKMGVIIHFGPGSLTGDEISWCRKGYRRHEPFQDSPWFGPPTVDSIIYDNLYKEFNPVNFNADEWVDIFKKAGFKYLLFVSKHHDGFCNWDTKTIDYKITNPESPYRKDVCKQISEACQKAGMKFGFYYSPVDWYDPDYFTDNHYKYIQKMHGQVEELVTNYGNLDLMFFDSYWNPKYWNGEKLIKKIKKFQPKIMIDERSLYKGDYRTPEGEFGNFNNEILWESLFMFVESWSWNPDYKVEKFKTYISYIARVAGLGGNIVWGVGPRPDGIIDPPQVDMLLKIGEWMKKYGEAIYGTKGGPYLNYNNDIFSTNEGSFIYIFVNNWKEREFIELPSLKMKILSIEAMTGGVPTLEQNNNILKIFLNKEDQDKDITIFKLKIEGMIPIEHAIIN